MSGAFSLWDSSRVKVIMNENQRANYFDRLTLKAHHPLSETDGDSHAGGKRKNFRFADEKSRLASEIRSRFERLESNSVIQNARMTFRSFIETKFIPEHVQHKTIAGQTHYQAMLKHLISPEAVNRMFNPRNVVNPRLRSLSDWPYLDQVRLCDLNPEHVRKLVAAAFAREYSWQTAMHIKNVTFAIISHAQQEGCFSGPNPVTQVKLPPRTHRVTPDLTMIQARQILQLLPAPEKHVAFITLSTGMKIQEVCNLQWKHVNLTHSPRVEDGELIPPYSIAVRAPWNRTGLGSVRQNRNRNIVVSPALFAVLADWASRLGEPNSEGFVVISDTGQHVSRAALRSSRLVAIGRKLNIPGLSWRVLSRTHHVLRSEFWPELDYIAGDERGDASAPLVMQNQYDISVFTQKSSTIASKFQ